MVPVDYPGTSRQTNLVAVSTTGAILDNVTVKVIIPQISSDSDPLWCIVALCNCPDRS